MSKIKEVILSQLVDRIKINPTPSEYMEGWTEAEKCSFGMPEHIFRYHRIFQDNQTGIWVAKIQKASISLHSTLTSSQWYEVVATGETLEEVVQKTGITTLRRNAYVADETIQNK